MLRTLGAFAPLPVVRVALAVALSLLGDSLLYAVLPSHFMTFGVEAGAVGLLLSINRFVRLVSNTWAARVYARVGRSTPFLAAVVVGAATTAAYGLTSGLVALLLARAVWGVCWSLLRQGGYLATLAAAPPQARGRTLGVYRSLSRTGSLVAVVLGSVLTDLAGPRATFLWLAAASATGALLAAPDALRDWRDGSQGRGQGGRPVDGQEDEGAQGCGDSATGRQMPPLADGDDAGAGRGLGAQARPAGPALSSWEAGTTGGGTEVSSAQLRAVNYGIFANHFASGGLAAATLGFLLRTRFGAEVWIGGAPVGVATATGLLLGTFWASDLLLAPAAGHLADRRGRSVVALASFAAATGGLMGLAAGTSLPVVALAAAGVFCASSILGTALDAALADMTAHGALANGAARSRLLGRYATWADLGSAMGPLLGYAIGAGLGLPVAYAGGAVALLAGAVLYAYGFQWRSGAGSGRPVPR